MLIEVKLPKQSEEQNESLITFWHVLEGDSVEKGQPIVEIQTEKAISEIEAPESGILKEIYKKRGDTVAVGEIMAKIETKAAEDGKADVVEDTSLPQETTSSDTPTASKNVPIKATPRVKKLAKELGVDLALITPSQASGKVTEDDVRKFAKVLAAEAQTVETEPEQPVIETPTEEHSARRRIFASPSVRKYAREHNVNLEDVVPKDFSGKVSKSDIDAHLSKQAEVVDDHVSGEQEAAVTHELVKVETEHKDEQRIPVTGIRRVIANAMVHSKSTIPHVTHFDEVNVQKLVAHRKDIKPYFDENGVKLTYLAYVVKALGVVLKKIPILNASYDGEKNEIILKNYYNIGVATDTDRGLLVPVIKDADKKSLYQVALEIQELANKARDGAIRADEMSGGTITISNIGSENGSWFTPIINAPQASILGIGRIEKKAVVIDDEIKIRPMLPLSLTYDHRLIDGATAQKVLTELKKYLSEPNLLLASI